MVYHFKFSVPARRKILSLMSDRLGVRAEYLGLPDCSFRVGDYTVSRYAEISWNDELNADEAFRNRTEELLKAIEAEGYKPAEKIEKEKWQVPRVLTDEEADRMVIHMGDGDWENLTDIEISEHCEVSISLPREFFSQKALTNLKRMVKNYRVLLEEALPTGDRELIIDESRVVFPWFGEASNEEIKAYTQFITALAERAVHAQHINHKVPEVENAKYQFRCFLLRLGMIGPEYSDARRILTANLTGSSAYKKEKSHTMDDERN